MGLLDLSCNGLQGLFLPRASHINGKQTSLSPPQPALVTLSGHDTEWEGILLPLGRCAELEKIVFGWRRTARFHVQRKALCDSGKSDETFSE